MVMVQKEFFIDKGLWRTTFIAACVIGALSGYAVYLEGKYQYLLFTAILFTLSFWQRNRKIITFKDDHFEMKHSMLGARQFVYYNQIVSVERKSSKRAKLFFEQSGNKRFLKLPLGVLNASDREKLIDNISQVSN